MMARSNIPGAAPPPNYDDGLADGTEEPAAGFGNAGGAAIVSNDFRIIP
jgi:hypothetical protein